MAFRSSSDATDRLLSGAVPLEGDVDAPEVTGLLAALRSPLSPDGAREQEVVDSIVAAVATAPVRLDDARSAGRHRVLKVAAIAGGLVMLFGTAAAAAGSLPDGAQSAVSRALSHVDVHVPDPGESRGSEHAADRAAAHTPVGPDATGAAHRGLCVAWAARNATAGASGRSGDSTAFTNLRHAAHDRGELVEQFCADVLAAGSGTPSSGADRGQSDGDHGRSGAEPGRSAADHGQSGDDHGQAGQDHGQSGDDHGPVVSTPSSGGISTGTQASHGSDSAGTAHASDPATAGAGNAGDHPAPASNRSR
jgi:hypothetical protein